MGGLARAALPVLAVVGCGSGTATISSPAPPPATAERDPLAADSIMADVAALCAPELAGRGAFQEGGRRAADYMARELAAAGLRVIRQPVPGGAENVIGVRGDLSGEVVIVSAHYDHLGVQSGGVFPGADDNASGAAVLLALARALSGEPGGRAILFIAFGAEEQGLVGSSAYLEKPIVPVERTSAVVNFDMIGRQFFEAGAATPATAAVVGLEGSERARQLVREGARRAGLRLIEAPARLLQLFRLENRTDDWVFRRLGVLSIHFSTGLHDDYHRVTDTADKLSPPQMERIARTAAHLIRGLAD
jgi:Zn-dependent M28 family amino/carboxypeptidase